jgi:hypothetical protein
MPEQKIIKVIEIVEHRAIEEDSPLEGIFKGGVGLVDVFDLFEDWTESEGTSVTAYVKQPQSIDAADIITIEDTPPESPFRKAGAQTTIWNRQGRSMHVVQPRSYIEQLKS